MKKHRAIIFIVILLVITSAMTLIHLHTREEVPEGAIEVVAGEALLAGVWRETFLSDD